MDTSAAVQKTARWIFRRKSSWGLFPTIRRQHQPFQSGGYRRLWIVTREALEPFRVAPPERVKPLLRYLEEATPNNYDVHLEIALQPAARPPTVISRTNAK